MEEKKKFEALQYSYENAGQFRAIAAILGYSEEYRNGDITFSKGNETYTYPLNTLKLGNLGDNRESLLEQSKERIISFFDKEQASNNFQEYSQYLRENHNVAIIKWDDIKQGTNKNEGYKDGFTVIDLENKIAYKGEDLYRYAYEQNQTLDGKGSYVDIDWNKFNEVGVKPENLSPEDIANIKNGKKTGMLNFSIEDTPGNRTLLDNEKVSYKTENGKEITIVNEELNKAAKVKLDLNARNGLSIKDANTIEIKATEKKEQTIGKERYISDKERLEFVAQKGAKGIDEIFKDKPTEMAAFLEKHKLSKDYASYKEVEKTYSSSREATKQTVGEQISTQMDKIDSSIKATAKQEASILGYGRTYGKNNDTPTMKL